MNKDQGSSEQTKLEQVLEAVKRGDGEAKKLLASFMLTGREGVLIDQEGAVILLQELVKDNDIDAMWMLGLCFEFGMGCEQDFEQAELLYKNSSDKGSAAGELLYSHGKNSRGTGVMNAGCLQFFNKNNGEYNHDIL